MKFNPIPSANKYGRSLSLFDVREAERLRAQMTDPASAREEEGVYYWVESGNIIPPSVFEDAFVDCPESHKAAYEAFLKAFAKAYRKRQPKRPSAEEHFEARAAFGPRVKVVDVISGRKFTT